MKAHAQKTALARKVAPAAARSESRLRRKSGPCRAADPAKPTPEVTGKGSVSTLQALANGSSKAQQLQRIQSRIGSSARVAPLVAPSAESRGPAASVNSVAAPKPVQRSTGPDTAGAERSADQTESAPLFESRQTLGLHASPLGSGTLGPTARPQFKIKVGPAGDRFEQEADSVASRVAAGQTIQPISRLGGASVGQELAEDEELQAQRVQRAMEDEEVQPLTLQRQPEEEEVQARRMQRAAEEEEVQTQRVQRAAEEEEVQASTLQRQPEEEELQAQRVQRAAEEEEVQASILQRQPEEEEVQTQRVQRAAEEEEVQASTLQRQPEEEELQAQRVQRAAEEEEVQASTLQRQPEEEEVQSKPLQRATDEEEVQTRRAVVQAEPVANTPDEVGDSSLHARISAPSGGHALPASVQRAMENGIGADFSGVRVHDSAQDRSDARSLNAQAFTYGSHVWLGQGANVNDRRLMAHELAHVVQQGAAVQRAPLPLAHTRPRVQRLSVKGKVLAKLASWARQVPGYHLLGVILGRDPISKKPIARDATNIIRAIIGLLPGGNLLYENLNKSGAMKRTGAWLSEQIDKLNLSWGTVIGLFSAAWAALSWTDVFRPATAWKKIKAVFAPTLGRIVGFVKSVGGKIAEFVLEGALSLAGSFGSKVMAVLRGAGKYFLSIVKDPIGFLGNLINALGKGFGQFRANITTHLKSGLAGWLFGAMQGTGLQMPGKFNLIGIFSIVTQILGLTYAAIRKRLVNLFGEERYAKVEKAVGFVADIATRGFAAVWDRISSLVSNIKSMVFTAVREWVVGRVVRSAVTKLLSMFNPAGAIIQAGIAIYNVVMFFVQRAQQIGALVKSVITAIPKIAVGAVGAAAGFIERSMAMALPVIISFLARLLNLGGIAGRIKGMIKAAREPVTRIISKVIGWIARKAKAFLAKVKKTGKAVVGKLAQWWKMRRVFKTKKGVSHSAYFRGRGASAVPVVASEEEPIETYIKSKKVIDTGLPEVAVALGHLENVKTHRGELTQLETAKKAEKGSAWKAKLASLNDEMRKMTAALAVILSAVDATAEADEPVVGTYGALTAKKAKDKKSDYTPHHVPPKGLARWLANRINDMLKGMEAGDEDKGPLKELSGRLAEEHDATSGRNLSCIMIHQATHISKELSYGDSVQWRVHYGSKTQKRMAELMENRGVRPILKKKKTLLTASEQKEFGKYLEEEQDNTVADQPSTQIYQSQLNAHYDDLRARLKKDIDLDLAMMRAMFTRTHAQSRTAVEVALGKSSKDGKKESHPAAMSKLQVSARDTWKNVGGAKIRDVTGL